MDGDFSQWRFDERTNADGVLHQQGRLLTDADWNQQARLSQRWRNQAARAAFGGRVAAVPESQKDGLRVTKANVDANGSVSLAITPGEVWADGLLTYLRGTGGVGGTETRSVDYLVPPTGGAPGNAGTRDAVVLEVWREALNAFQVPHEYLEPALGGVDTTERVWHGLALHLVRMKADEDCEDVSRRIQDEISKHGRLTVELEQSEVSGDPCPVVIGGGYSGLEHHLYRIEIAQVDGNAPMFKWSQFNGGLVGRAKFDPVTRRAKILANRQAIIRSGLQNFYIEVFQPAPDRPAPPVGVDRNKTAQLAEQWQLVYGGHAALASDEEIDLSPNGDQFRSIPADKNQEFFFRIWNELRPVAHFQSSPAAELRDGIRLQFTGGGAYKHGDYWTFPVRVDEVTSTEPLIDDQPPEGLERIRVPLAVLNWAGNPEISVADREIDDCRKVFSPLTDLPPGCCLAVEPGQDLHAAIKRVKKAGAGCICLLPGEHRIRKPVDLTGSSNIRFHGFGLASQLFVETRGSTGAAFNLKASSDIRFGSFAILNPNATPIFACGATSGLELRDMFLASDPSASTVTIGDTTSTNWHIAGNVFVSRSGIEGFRLSHSRVAENTFVGSTHGIHLSDLFDTHAVRNRFLGISRENLYKATAASVNAIMQPRSLATREARIAALLRGLESAARGSPNEGYCGAWISGFLDSKFNGNRIIGGTGLFAEIVENCEVCDNEVQAAVEAALFGLIRGLEFSDNRIGEHRSRQRFHMSPRTGMRVLLDASDCRITNNSFLEVGEAIVFESDLSGKGKALRHLQASLKVKPKADDAEVLTLVSDAAKYVKAYQAGTRIVGSPFFRVGKCERVLIEGNALEADTVGIEWSGTKDIVDFRISRNVFIGCRNGAILIEPDDRVQFIPKPADPEGIDTKARLIEGNRFDIHGVAIRSTIAALRVARNDIRVRRPVFKFLPTIDFFGALKAGLPKASDLTEAVTKRDFGRIRMHGAEAMAAANTHGIEMKAFHAKADEKLGSRELYVGDSIADSLSLMSKLASVGAEALLFSSLVALTRHALSGLEGFTVNLAGPHNEVVENNLISHNEEFNGGVVLHLPSGLISGNEIQVGQSALLANSPVGQPRDKLRIEGNRLKVTGPSKGDGKRAAAYALAIPTLSPGNYAISNNQFDGSIMVGTDPFAALGLVQGHKLYVPPLKTYYHGLAFDENILVHAIKSKDQPAKYIPATVIDTPLLIETFVEAVSWDPHKSRPVIQFSDNRVVRGFAALAPSGGTFWSKEALKNNAASAPIIQMTGNVFDYWVRVVGWDLILVGNHSQGPVQFRATSIEHVEHMANMPKATPF
jgi:hypothetical protein